MSIPQSRYVEITSGVGGNGPVRERELILRLISTNPLIPTGSVLEFTSASEVSNYFGSSSIEYLRAQFYFAWISKNITAPEKISFYRWVDVDAPATIYGKPATYVLGSFTGVAAGDFTLTLAGFTHHVTGVDLTMAASLAAVAAAVQAAIRTYSAGGSAWTAATVAYDATRGSFNFESGVDGDDDTIAILAGSVTDIASLLGWLTGAILSDGADSQTITESLIAGADISTNFGSFVYIPTLTLDQVTEASEWNETQNVLYMYSVPVTAANATAWSAALINQGGTTLTLAPLSSEYPEQVPTMILAATDYSRRDSVQNYMFQLNFDLTPSVTTTSDADLYDGLRINYYGQTQTSGQLILFYQRGVMMGGTTDPVDQNVYANEQWFKDAAAAQLFALLLALPKVSANKVGRSQLLAVIQEVINLALFNGTVSVGKPLTIQQKLFIASQTGDPDAWHQVQNIGYWVDCVITTQTTEDSRIEYIAKYTLIYSKDDDIRKIEGTHILI